MYMVRIQIFCSKAWSVEGGLHDDTPRLLSVICVNVVWLSFIYVLFFF